MMEWNKIMFLDVETVPQSPDYERLSEPMQVLWNEKSAKLQKDETPSETYRQAGIYAEFGKIVCISVGFIYYQGNERHFRLKSFASHDERELLRNFIELLNRFCAKTGTNLCGHNIKEFDVPYIARRILINGLNLPSLLNVAGKKPWEVRFFDTLELWKFGDYKHYTSLKLLTAIFNIPSPKDDIEGSLVAQVYYEENNLERISAYCQKDVLATAQLLLRMNGEPLIEPEWVEYV